MVRRDGQITDESRIYLCFKVEIKIPVMLMLYVDKFFLIGKEELFRVARRRLSSEFEMKDLDMMHFF